MVASLTPKNKSTIQIKQLSSNIPVKAYWNQLVLVKIMKLSKILGKMTRLMPKRADMTSS
jgi:hypothetical protein